MGTSGKKWDQIDLTKGLSDQGFDAISTADELRSVVNLRAPRLQGIPSRQFAIEGPSGSLPHEPNVIADDGTGRSVFVNTIGAQADVSGSVSQYVVGAQSEAFTAMTASTGFFPGAQIMNSWLPVLPKHVFNDTFGSAWYGNMSCQLTPLGNVAAAVMTNDGANIIFVLLSPTGRPIIPKQNIPILPSAIGAFQNPIQITCHDDEKINVWWSEVRLGNTAVTSSICLRYIDAQTVDADTKFGPQQFVAQYVGNAATDVWSVTTCEGAGNDAYLAYPAPAPSSNNDLRVSRIATTMFSNTIVASANLTQELPSQLAVMNIVAGPSNPNPFITVGWISGSQNGSGVVTSGQAKIACYEGSGMTVLVNPTTVSSDYLDGIVVGHSVLSTTAPNIYNPVAFVSCVHPNTIGRWCGTKACTFNFTYGTGSLNSVQFHANKVPVGNTAMFKSGSTGYCLVPFKHTNGPTNDPTTTDVVLDPSIEVYMGRPYGDINADVVRWTFDSILRTAVDELTVQRSLPPVTVMATSGSTLLLGNCTSVDGIDPFSAGTNFVTWNINPPGPFSTIGTSFGSTILAGQPMFWDGSETVESGFLHAPVMSGSPSGGTTPGYLPGTYAWQAIYTWRDSKGDLHRSSPSLPYSMTVASGASPRVWVGAPNTVRSGTLQSKATIELYATEQNGTSYTRLPSAYASSSFDSALLAYKFSAMQPGLPEYTSIYSDGGANSELPAEAPPALYDGCEVGNRLWAISSENRSKLFFTKPKVLGVAYEWNVFTNNILLDESAGPSHFIREMSGFPVVGCDNGIYVIPGEGPNALGFGQFGTPQKIVSDGVHPDSRLLACETPAGVFFKGKRSYAFLQTAGGQVNRLSNVDATDTAIQSRYVPASEELLVFLEQRTLSIDPFTMRVAEVAWDQGTPRDIVNTSFSSTGSSVGAWMVFSGSVQGVDDVTVASNSGSWTLETGWMTPAGPFVDVSFSNIAIDCVYLGSGSGLIVKQYFNWDDDNADTVVLSSDVVTGSAARLGSRVRLQVQVKKSDAVAMKLILSESAPLGRTTQTILPIQLLIGYTDQGKEATPSRHHMGDVQG